MMNIRLKYGSEFIDLSLPDEQIMGVYPPKEKKAVENLNQAIRNALTCPIGSKRLDQMVQPNHKVVVLVDDATRSVPSAEMLVPIVDELAKARVPDKS
ncbi:MAG: lactate racemase domain-containing protein, partial [Planctomycetota bacterium]